MSVRLALLGGGLAVSAVVFAGGASAATFFGPTPYLSSADIPAGFYAGGPAFLETFEDGTLDGGITASTGSVLGPSALTDSVDADDGTIDGSGTKGHSFFLGGPVTFTFSAAVTAAALVWTDGNGKALFEAFGPGGSLGSIGPVAVGDGSFGGTTSEDRFFGVQDPGGITSISITTGGSIEVDHVQYGAAAVSATPLPAALPLFASGVGGLGILHWRRKKKAARTVA